jgi:IclR family transcriptional regulator, pca regulon regulatory protein
LTPKVLDLGYAYLASAQIADLALPFMEELSERIHESVSAAVLDGTDIVYVARVPTRKIMRLSLGIGSKLPAAQTSMGRVLLADLPPEQFDDLLPSIRLEHLTTRTITDQGAFVESICAVRSQGWALVDQELEEAVRSIAAPLRDRSGRAVAAINVGTQASLVSLKELRSELLPQLLECAASISAQLAKR